MKKLLAFALSVALVFSMAIPTYAEENHTTGETLSYEIDSRRIEDAVVDISCFTNEALNYVEMYVSEDQNGTFYIREEEVLRTLLTSEQYSLVEEQIRLISEYGNITPYVAIGTEGNPHVLTKGTASSVTTSSEYWFSCTVAGATDFVMESTQNSTHITYKKTLFGKTELTYNYGTYTIKTVSDHSINSGTNTYLIHYIPVGSGTLTCKVSQHVDKYYRSAGAKWTYHDYSAIPDTLIFYHEYWYVPAQYVEAVYDTVNEPNFLDTQEDLANGVITAASIAAGIATAGSSVPVSILTTFVSGIGSFAISQVVDFKSAILNDIREIGGYNSSTCEYSNGVLLIRAQADGMMVYFVEPWDGNILTGPPGWTGSWDTSDNPSI